MIDLTETLNEFIFKRNDAEDVISYRYKGIVINFNKYVFCHTFFKKQIILNTQQHIIGHVHMYVYHITTTHTIFD